MQRGDRSDHITVSEVESDSREVGVEEIKGFGFYSKRNWKIYKYKLGNL